MNKYEQFWLWFSDNEERIYNTIEINTLDISTEIVNQLKQVHKELEFEIPFDHQNNKKQFIISADGLLYLFEEVQELVQSASRFHRWDIIAFRPRTYQIDQVIELDGLCLCYEDIFFTHSSTVPMDIDVYIKNYDETDHRYVHAYFLLLDTLIGEYDSVTKINNTTVSRYDQKLHLQALPLIRIISIIDKVSKLI